jgi:pimeloyl-ACP methyl ester carboxylesterase
MIQSLSHLAIVIAALYASRSDAAPPPGYHAKINVSGPTRLDWTFALSNRSLADPPADWTPDYDAIKQAYELFVPSPKDNKAALPVILFISPGKGPMGWKSFEKICKDQGFIFVSPHNAGNDCPPKRRIRIVLDVLDDVRRNFPTDADRTYIAGFSGGGRIACHVAFALPELFGGVMPICAAEELRAEPWLRHRVIDRLSVALLTGENDFNRSEVERLRGPFLAGVGVRARVWTQAGLGHGVPGEALLSEALKWLEDDLARRQKLAKKFPATRLAGNAAPDRAAMAKAIFDDGKQRLAQRETVFAGLMLMQGCLTRWPDAPAAAEAKKLLLDYEARKEKPWEQDDIAEQRRFLIARARALDAYASGELPAVYAKERPQMAKQAAELWKQVVDDNPDSDAGREGKKRIPELEKLAAMK